MYLILIAQLLISAFTKHPLVDEPHVNAHERAASAIARRGTLLASWQSNAFLNVQTNFCDSNFADSASGDIDRRRVFRLLFDVNCNSSP